MNASMVNRRQLVQAVAWSAPAIASALALPAHAGSGAALTCPDGTTFFASFYVTSNGINTNSTPVNTPTTLSGSARCFAGGENPTVNLFDGTTAIVTLTSGDGYIGTPGTTTTNLIVGSDGELTLTGFVSPTKGTVTQGEVDLGGNIIYFNVVGT